MIDLNCDNGVFKECPQPLFKIKRANDQLEQTKASSGRHPVKCRIIHVHRHVRSLVQNFRPIGSLNFLRNHQAVLDTVNGAMTFLRRKYDDKDKRGEKSEVKSLRIRAEGNQTTRPQQTTAVSAIAITTTTDDITGAIQPLPPNDEIAKINVASALATTKQKKHIKIRTAKKRSYHSYKKPNQVGQTKEDDNNDDNFWFPTLENPGNEDKHTPEQPRILKENRKLIQEEELDLKKSLEPRKAFPNIFKCKG